MAKHVQHLCAEIGPRPPTSSAEALAANYCVSVLKDAGLEPRIEPFKGLRSFGSTYIPISATLLLSSLKGARKHPFKPLGFGLSFSALACYWGENTSRWRPVTEKLSHGASQNVVAVLPPSKEPLARLVLTTHLDSSRSGLAFDPKQVKGFRRNILVASAAAAASTIAWLLPRPLRRLISLACSAVFATSLAVLAQREVAGTDVEGANDNASGVGVLLAIAESLAAAPLENTEVWFVFTGCEESGLIGMNAFLDRHSNNLEDAWFIGLDSVGGRDTQTIWVRESSILEPLQADLTLTRLCEEVSKEQPGIRAREGDWRTAGLDTDAAAVRGHRVLSIMALTDDELLPNWHWPTDVYDELDEDALRRCFDFAIGVVRRFDEQA